MPRLRKYLWRQKRRLSKLDHTSAIPVVLLSPLSHSQAQNLCESLVWSLEHARIYYQHSKPPKNWTKNTKTLDSERRRSSTTDLDRQPESRLVLKVQVPGCPHVLRWVSQWLSLFRNNIRSLFLGSFYVVILSFRYFMKQKYFFKSGPPTWDGMGYNRAFWIILVQQFWNLTHRLAWKRVIFKDAGEDQIDGIDHESVPLAVSRVTCSILSCLLDCQLSSSCGAPHRTIPAAAASQDQTHPYWEGSPQLKQLKHMHHCSFVEWKSGMSDILWRFARLPVKLEANPPMSDPGSWSVPMPRTLACPPSLAGPCLCSQLLDCPCGRIEHGGSRGFTASGRWVWQPCGNQLSAGPVKWFSTVDHFLRMEMVQIKIVHIK